MSAIHWCYLFALSTQAFSYRDPWSETLIWVLLVSWNQRGVIIKPNGEIIVSVNVITPWLQYWDSWLQADLSVSKAGWAQCEIKHLLPAYVFVWPYHNEVIMAANREKIQKTGLEISEGQRDIPLERRCLYGGIWSFLYSKQSMRGFLQQNQTFLNCLNVFTLT